MPTPGLKNGFLNKSNLHIAGYGLALAAIIFALKWMQWQFFMKDNVVEVYVGLVALLFTALGVWIAGQLIKPKVETITVERQVIVALPAVEVRKKGTDLPKDFELSQREAEVLEFLSAGLSNAEIGEKLFLSVSTVKTHVSNLYVKMEVKSRTQAIEKARQLGYFEHQVTV